MDELAIVRERLHRQRLAGEPFATPAEAVRRLGAVQGQEHAEARWSLALRVRGVDEAAVEAALASGEIIRTHVLRPTWHLVAAEDLRWLMRLTGPRVLARTGPRFAELGLDGATFARSDEIIARALEPGVPLVRGELSAALEQAGVATDGQRMPAILMHAEMELLICSGPRRGRHHTYALVDRVVPEETRVMGRDESLAELARRFFASHGPATIRDLSWWASLTAAEARDAVALAGDALEPVAEAMPGGGEWIDAAGTAGGGSQRAGAAGGAPGDPAAGAGGVAAPGAGVTGTLLIPTYDEVLVAYRDFRCAVARGAPVTAMLGRFVLSDEQAVGTWKRTLRAREVVVEVTLGARPGAALAAALEAEAERFGRFVGLPARLVTQIAG